MLNQNITFRMSILETSITGAAVYSETHQLTTNEFGSVNLHIGTGQVIQGNFSTIVWGNDSHFLKTELDATGGINFVEMGTSQLVSVPYAFYTNESKTSRNGKTTLGLYGNINDSEAEQIIESDVGPNT
jgi:hypothetical protein